MLNQNIKIIRSSRKSISMEVRSASEVIIRAPLNLPVHEIEEFIEKHSDWLTRHLEIAAERAAQTPVQVTLTEDEIRKLAKRAVNEIPSRVAYYASIIGVTYGRITIRNQKTKWGSCSASGNLNFNCCLMRMPTEILDYVIVHELCHRKEMNHSERFWNEVAKVIPDYKIRMKWLKEHGQSGLS